MIIVRKYKTVRLIINRLIKLYQKFTYTFTRRLVVYKCLDPESRVGLRIQTGRPRSSRHEKFRLSYWLPVATYISRSLTTFFPSSREPFLLTFVTPPLIEWTLTDCRTQSWYKFLTDWMKGWRACRDGQNTCVLNTVVFWKYKISILYLNTKYCKYFENTDVFWANRENCILYFTITKVYFDFKILSLFFILDL